MQIKDASEVCFRGCCSSPFRSNLHAERYHSSSPKSTTTDSRTPSPGAATPSPLQSINPQHPPRRTTSLHPCKSRPSQQPRGSEAPNQHPLRRASQQPRALVKGRILSIEAIHAIQALKRCPPSSLDSQASSILPRLLKADLLSTFKELVLQK